MAVIQSNRPNGGDYEKRQGVLLPKRGIYGAFVARYTMPKEYTSQWGTKEKLGFGFVITHDQAYRQLPQFADAFRLMPNTLFFDPKKNTASNLTEYLYAFRGGRKTKAEIVEQDVYDYDDFVGRPVMLLAEPGEKPDAEGFRYNNIIGVDPVDKEMFAAMKPILDSIQIAMNEKTGLKYVKSPSGAYVENAPSSSETGSNFGDEDFAGLDTPDNW
jgi:hypothetical protein